MRRAILLATIAWTSVAAQEVPVDHVTFLEARSIVKGHEEARKLTSTHSFWVAYQVAVKPNVAIDTHEVNVPWDATIRGPDVSVNVSPSTPALGIFVHYEENKEIDVQVFNLRRKHDFGAVPVFWLGQKPDGESLEFLQALLKTRPDLGVGLVRAIGIHSDNRSTDVLKAQATLSTVGNHAYAEALCWIGQSYGQSSFLSDLASDAGLPLDERSAAVLALLESPDPQARQVISRLRWQVRERRIQNLIDRYSREITNSSPQAAGPKT